MNQMERLAGKRALMTGGSRGIGAAIVRRLASDDAAVAVNYVADQSSADALVAELTGKGHRAVALRADVSDRGQTHQLVQQTVARLGGLGLLASNAGIEHFGALESITPEDFDRVFRINVAGQLFATQAAATAMTFGGRILLTSSVSARIGVYQHTLYAASKAAVAAMVLNLAPELAERGIAINAIAPGGTATDMAAEVGALYIPPARRNVAADAVTTSMTALGRLADPDEIAAVTPSSPSQPMYTSPCKECDWVVRAQPVHGPCRVQGGALRAGLRVRVGCPTQWGCFTAESIDRGTHPPQAIDGEIESLDRCGTSPRVTALAAQTSRRWLRNRLAQ